MRKGVLADLALIFIAIMWGITFLPMAKALQSNGVFTILFYRFAFASILLLPFWFMWGRTGFSWASLGRGAVLGLFLFLGFATQTFALKYSLSSAVAFITGLNVIFVPFIVLVLFKQALSVYAKIGAALAAVGLYFLSAAEFGLGLGEVLSTLCAIFYSFHIIYIGRFAPKSELYTLVLTQFIAVALLSFVGAFWLENKAIAVWNEIFIFTLIITTFFATFVAFLVQNWAQKYTSAVKTALIFTLEPVSAGLIGYFFGERLSPLQLMGAFMILAGIILSELGSFLPQLFKASPKEKASASHSDDASTRA